MTQARTRPHAHARPNAVATLDILCQSLRDLATGESTQHALYVVRAGSVLDVATSSVATATQRVA